MLVPRLFLCLALLACTAPQYNLRTVKIGLVAPLSGPAQGEGHHWVQIVRDAVREWNLSVLVGKPHRVELVIYDEAEGPAVARRLAVDPEVLGVLGRARAIDGLAVIPAGSATEVSVAARRLLEAVTGALDRPGLERRAAVGEHLRGS